MQSARSVLVLLASLVSASALPVHAGPSAAESSPGLANRGEGWHGQGFLYTWMANINGTQTVKGNEADLDLSFGDILDALDFVAEGRVEAMKDNRWGFYVDGTYLKLGPEAKKGPIHMRLGYKYWLWDFGGIYRAKTWETRQGKGALDLMLGGRYTSMDVELDFRNRPLPNVSGSQAWTDLVTGARVLLDLPYDWTMSLRADVGGFGIGGSSNLSAQGILVFLWRFRPSWDLAIGYRALYQDYENGRGANKFAYDATTHGPVLGIGYRF